jgi:hypothetical protein
MTELQFDVTTVHPGDRVIITLAEMPPEDHLNAILDMLHDRLGDIPFVVIAGAEVAVVSDARLNSMDEQLVSIRSRLVAVERAVPWKGPKRAR